MSVKLSHSSKNKYLQCAHSYKLHYVDRWRSIIMSSALSFGSAIDNASNTMLENKDNPECLKLAIDTFNRSWEQGEDYARKTIDLPLNPNVKYFKSDHEPDLLEKKQWAELFKYDGNLFETRNSIDEKLKAGIKWLDIPEEQRSVYNYTNWLCLQKKGQLLLTAYHKEILPQFKEVLAVQMKVELIDDEGNNLNGVIDLVARLHDGRVMVIDNKTTSTEYDEDSVSMSEQLATYVTILNIFNDDPEHSWKHKVDGAGYAVMSKKLIKEVIKICKTCNHSGTGSHKTCDNVINGTRCNGDWDKTKKFDVKTQFILGTISEEFGQSVLENATTVKSCIEQGLFPKNFSACADMFGSPCPMIGLCHNGDTKGLVKLEDNKK